MISTETKSTTLIPWEVVRKSPLIRHLHDQLTKLSEMEMHLGSEQLLEVREEARKVARNIQHRDERGGFISQQHEDALEEDFLFVGMMCDELLQGARAISIEKERQAEAAKEARLSARLNGARSSRTASAEKLPELTREKQEEQRAARELLTVAVKERLAAQQSEALAEVKKIREARSMEVKTGGPKEVKTSERLSQLIREKMARNKSLSFSDAFNQVQKENPELARAYSKELRR